jgi:Uma2 family endonuclease
MATATRTEPMIEPPAALGPEAETGPETIDPIVPPPGDVFYEVVDGVVVEVPPMGIFEADIANLIAELMNEHARPRRLGRAFVEVLYRIDVGREIRRQPDVAFVSAARWPTGKRAPKASSWQVVPDIAVEVVSPSDQAAHLNRKILDYFRAGTVAVWVIDQETQQVYVYSSPTDVRILTPPAELDGGELIPGFRLPLARLFEDEPSPEQAPSGA